MDQRERELRDTLEDLSTRAERLQRHDRAFHGESSSEHHDDPWTESIRRTLLETARAGQTNRPSLHSIISNLPLPTEPVSDEHQPTGESSESRAHEHTPRTVLPTPPLDQSEPDNEDISTREDGFPITRPSHPLRVSWRPESPVNGLGDRNRSPSPLPQDAWEIMEATIEPDTTLPSTDSSFTAQPATSSFASSRDTAITEPEQDTSSGSSRRRSTEDDDADTQSDSATSIDAGDVPCTEDEDITEAESFARDMYYHEARTAEGRERIANLQAELRRQFAPGETPTDIDIGFRLADQAMHTPEGRARLFAITGDEADRFLGRSRSPPQQTQRPRQNVTTSRDPPSAHPVSPPLDVVLNEIDSDDESFQHTRRVVQRLAQRQDVPDDWWMSIGITPSMLGRQRRRSPDGVRRADMASQRVRSGRVERGNARL